MVRKLFNKLAVFPVAAAIVFVSSMAVTQSVSAQTSCSMRVLLENAPFPNNNPNAVSGNLTFSDAVSTQTATIPASTNPMNNAILYINERDCPIKVDAITITDDDGVQTPAFTEVFGGMTVSADSVYEFPTGAETWAGVGNGTAALNPFNITSGATVSITGRIQTGDPACDDTSVIRFEDAFGNAVVDCATDTYTFPAAAEAWAGFGDSARGDYYPFLIPGGATITFDGSTASGSADVTFAFEDQASPATDSALTVRPAAVSVSGTTTSYSIDVPASPTVFNNLILYLETRDVPVTVSNITVTPKPAPAATATPVPVSPLWMLGLLAVLAGWLGARRTVKR